MAALVTGVGFFIPIFAFLFVFVVVYAMLKKTEVLGSSDFIMILISFILASFFILQASLVEFVRFTSAWFSVGIVALFFLLVTISFLPGDKSPKIFEGKSWPGYLVLLLMVLFFIVSAGYVFNLAVNWHKISSMFNNDVMGAVLLIIIAAVVAVRITKKE